MRINNKIMKTEYLIKALTIQAILLVTTHAEEATPTKDYPIYKYGYVISHKEGGSQAHVETRNGNMTLGRYYVNFPNGSGQKVTYLADDVGFHTGVVYNSQTSKGSSKTQIAMGHKALATLENLDTTQRAVSTANTVTPKSVKAAKESVTVITPKPEHQSNVNYTFTKGFYLLRRPVESVTITSNHIGSSSPSAVGDSDLQQSNADVQKAVYLNSENVQAQPVLQPPPPEVNGYYSFIQNKPAIVEASEQQQTNDRIPMYTNDKSIEKTFLSDLDAQLISKIQKHADDIIMNDLRKKESSERKQKQNQRLSFTNKPILSVTMQPIVVTSSDDASKGTSSPDIKKTNKFSHSGTINSLKVDEKSSGNGSEDQYAKTSTKVEVSYNITKPINRNADSTNFTLCEGNSCAQDSNRAFSDNLLSIKPRTDNNLKPGLSSAQTGHNIAPNFYPKNQLKHEMHFVTTIDVQKGISLEVQQNEDGSIRLANDFPFNKLPNYQRPYSPSTAAPILSNSITPSVFQSTQNIHFTPQKQYVVSPVTPAPQVFGVTPNQNLPVLDNSQNFQQQQHQQNNQGKVEFVYQLPQPISSGITHITTDQDNNNIQQGPQPPTPSPQSHLVYDVSSLQQQIEDQRKQNFVEEERKQYFENLKKVEEIKQQNAVTVQPQVEIHSNGLLEDVTASPLLPIETNSIKPTSIEPEQQVQYVPELQTPNYQNSVTNYVPEVPVTYPTVQQIQTPVVYQKPVFAYAPQYVSSEAAVQGAYYEPQHIQNVFIDNSIQQTSQTTDKVDLTQYAKIAPVNLETQYVLAQPAQAEEKVEQAQHLTLSPNQVNSVPVPVEPRFLREPKGHQLGSKTILINPLMVDYGRAFKVQQPVSVLGAYPMQLQAGSEQVAVPAFYQLPQQYQLSVPVQLPQPQNVRPSFPPPSFNTPVPPGQYHVTMSYKPTPNKLRIQPLKPSPPAEDETRAETIRNILSQPQFNPTYYYAGFPMNRIQLRHINRNKQSTFDQATSQTLKRQEKSLKNLKIEYGFKPPLRPSVEYTEEVKPSIYGPSVPQR